MKGLTLSAKRPLNLAFYFPGQAIKRGPNVDSLREVPELGGIAAAFTSTLQEIVGKEVAAKVLEGSPEEMKFDTHAAQLRSLYGSSVMWVAFLKASFAGEPTAEKLINSGMLNMQVSGDSCGGVTAAFAPGPGHIDDQVNRFALGLKAMSKRGELIQETPHNYELGGMAVISKILPFAPLPVFGQTVHDLTARVNKKLGQAGLMRVVKYNAPRLTAVAGPRAGLDLMRAAVTEKGGVFIDNISPYWFHHSMVMEAFGKIFGTYLADPANMGKPSEALTYVSNVTGRIVPPKAIGSDIASGVWKPVRFFTPYLPSVHGTAYSNGCLDAIILNPEIQNWLKSSKHVAAHLMTDLNGLQEAKAWLISAVRGEVKPGKAYVNEPATPSPQLSHSTPYLARS